MKVKELYRLSGDERLKAIDNMTVYERDDVCELFSNCMLCPFALIYNSKPICAKISFHHRIRLLLAKGGRFTTLEDVENEKIGNFFKYILVFVFMPTRIAEAINAASDVADLYCKLEYIWCRHV